MSEQKIPHILNRHALLKCWLQPVFQKARMKLQEALKVSATCVQVLMRSDRLFRLEREFAFFSNTSFPDRKRRIRRNSVVRTVLWNPAPASLDVSGFRQIASAVNAHDSSSLPYILTRFIF
ncbi:MAG: hypothetical protein ACYCOR_17475 [Acidobacteriaceae bacterium]